MDKKHCHRRVHLYGGYMLLSDLMAVDKSGRVVPLVRKKAFKSNFVGKYKGHGANITAAYNEVSRSPSPNNQLSAGLANRVLRGLPIN